jgi:hypothetical protein
MVENWSENLDVSSDSEAMSMIRFKAEVGICRRASKWKQCRKMNGSHKNSGAGVCQNLVFDLQKWRQWRQSYLGVNDPLRGRDLWLSDDVTTGIPTCLHSWFGIPHQVSSSRKDAFDQNWNMSPNLAKICKYQNFTKIVQRFLVCCMRTNRHNGKANRRLLDFLVTDAPNEVIIAVTCFVANVRPFVCLHVSVQRLPL